MSFPTSWNPFGAFLSCTCWRSELDYASVNAETFCTKDILSQTLCSEDDFRQLPGRRLRPRLRVWSLALMAFLTSSLMCSLPSQVWEKVFFASLSFQCECFTRFVVVVVLNPVLSFWVLALCQGSMYGVERCPVFVLPPLTVHSQRPLSRDVLSHLCRAIDS